MAGSDNTRNMCNSLTPAFWQVVCCHGDSLFSFWCVTFYILLQQRCDTLVIPPSGKKTAELISSNLFAYFCLFVANLKDSLFVKKGTGPLFVDRGCVCIYALGTATLFDRWVGSILGAFPVYLPLHFHTDDKSTICLQSDNKHHSFSGRCKVSPLSAQQLHQSKQTASPGLEKES